MIGGTLSVKILEEESLDETRQNLRGVESFGGGDMRKYIHLITQDPNYAKRKVATVKLELVLVLYTT